MNWCVFHLFLLRALLHASWEPGQAPHADDYSSALPSARVCHRSHQGRHSAWHWEKRGWCALSPGTETVWRLTTGSVFWFFSDSLLLELPLCVPHIYCIQFIAPRSPRSSRASKLAISGLSKPILCLLWCRWEKRWLQLLVIGYFTWETDTLISTNSSLSCWAASVMRSQK